LWKFYFSSLRFYGGITKQTGFEFDAALATNTEPATTRELDALSFLDPDGAFESEVRI